MGMTAENLHDRYPHITKQRADEYAVRSQEKAAKAYANGKIQQDLVPISVRRTNAEAGETGWGLVTADEPMRPGTTLENLAGLKTPFRAHGRVTAGQRRRSQRRRHRLAHRLRGLRPRARTCRSRCAWSPTPSRVSSPRSWATARSRPPRRPSPRRACRIEDIGLFEINEAFAVQVLAFLDHYGIADDDARVNQYGGAIAFGHPLASSGVRLMTQLARQFEEQPEVRYGLTTMCVGFGMGATVIWENPHFKDAGGNK